MAKKTDNKLIKVPFNGGHVLVIQGPDGERLIVNSLCSVLSMDESAQRKRMKRDSRLSTCGVILTLQIPGDDQRRPVLTIPRRKLAAFLYGIQPSMVKDAKVRENLEQLQDELEEVMQAYFEARMGGATKEQIQEAIRTAVQAAVGPLKAELSDTKAMLQGRLSVPCGKEEKASLSALAADVAELSLAVEGWKSSDPGARKGTVFRRRLGDVQEDAASHTKVAARAWDLLTIEEAARMTCYLEQRRRKFLRRLKSKGAQPILRGRQLKLVV